MKKILTLLLLIVFLCPQGAMAKKKSRSSIPENSGYVGTLPDVTQRFQKSAEEEAKPTFDYKDGFNDPDGIKPIPRNNPSFVNIIMKKDKTSQYVNDLNELITIIEKLQDVIENKENVQKFNAASYFLKENVEYFRDKYKNKSEQSYLSYKKVLELNSQVQAISLLRAEKEVYSPYVTAEGTGNMFSQNNINNQLDYLDSNIKKTLVILKETR